MKVVGISQPQMKCKRGHPARHGRAAWTFLVYCCVARPYWCARVYARRVGSGWNKTKLPSSSSSCRFWLLYLWLILSKEERRATAQNYTTLYCGFFTSDHKTLQLSCVSSICTFRVADRMASNEIKRSTNADERERERERDRVRQAFPLPQTSPSTLCL